MDSTRQDKFSGEFDSLNSDIFQIKAIEPYLYRSNVIRTYYKKRIFGHQFAYTMSRAK